MTQTIQAYLPGGEQSLELNGTWSAYWLFILRIMAGWWMFHAGFTKLWESYVLGVPFDGKWFIQFASQGSILEGFLLLFDNSAGIALTNIMIPWGEFLIGVGLLLGAFTRLAAFFGAVLMFFFYFVNAGWSHGLVNGELMGLLVFVTVGIFAAGQIWGIDRYFDGMAWAQHPIGKAILG